MNKKTIFCLAGLSCIISTGLLAEETGAEKVPEPSEVLTQEAVTPPPPEPSSGLTPEAVTPPTPPVTAGGGPGKSKEAVEWGPMQAVDWLNNIRLLGPIGYIPPAEAE